MANMYSSPNYQTPQGQQYDMNSGMPVTMSPQQVQQTSNQAAQASTQLAAMQTPQNRSTYVNNGDLPAIQQNYDQLAKQLYDIDKAIAAQPQFNSTPPPDAISSSGVEASPLALTESLLSGNTFSNPNPSFGLQTKINHNSNVLDLLGILNDSLAKEFNSRKNTYASTVKSQQSLVDSLMTALDKNSQLAMDIWKEQQANARAASSRSDTKKTQYITLADKLRSDLSTGTIQWGDAWKQLQMAAGSDLSPAEIDSLLGGKYDPSDPTGAAGKTTGWAKPGAAQEYATGLRYKQTGTSSSDQDFQNVMSGLDSYLDRRKGSNIVDRVNPASSRGIELDREKQAVGQLMGKLIEQNRMSDADRKFYLGLMDKFWYDDSQAQSAIDGVKNAIAGKLGLVRVRDKASGQTGTVPMNEFDPGKYDRI